MTKSLTKISSQSISRPMQNYVCCLNSINGTSSSYSYTWLPGEENYEGLGRSGTSCPTHQLKQHRWLHFLMSLQLSADTMLYCQFAKQCSSRKAIQHQHKFSQLGDARHQTLSLYASFFGQFVFLHRKWVTLRINCDKKIYMMPYCVRYIND